MTAIELWMQDKEFLCTVLLSNVGSGKSGNREKDKDVKKETGSQEQNRDKENAKGKQEANEKDSDNDKLSSKDDSSWGSTTLGQCVVAMEFAWAVRELRIQSQSVSYS